MSAGGLRGRVKVLYVHHVAAVGGAERSLLDLLKRLDRARFAPYLALPAEGGLSEEARALDVRTYALPMRRLKRTGNPFALAGAAVSSARVCRELASIVRDERIDLLHANSNQAQWYAGRAARAAGVPCLWHSRDLVDLGGFAGRRLFSTATRVVAISACVREHLRRYAPADEGIVTIPNGIDPEEWAPGAMPDEERASFSLSRDSLVVAMVAHLVPWKNHEAFLESAALIAGAMPRARFLVVGGDLLGDHSDYRKRLEMRAGALGLRDRVRFTGWRRDVAKLMQGVDILVHPAEREPWGRAVAEAMAMGRAVVAVNACGPSELITDGVDGVLVPSANPRQLARAALTLGRDPALRARLGTAAREKIRAAFDVKATVAAVERLYEEVLRGDAADVPAGGGREGSRPEPPRAAEPATTGPLAERPTPAGARPAHPTLQGAGRGPPESILVGIDGLLLCGNFSGVESSILNLARALARIGRERYRLYLPEHSPAGQGLTTPSLGCAVAPVSGRNRAWRILWEQARLPARLSQDRVDLLHAPGYVAPAVCRTPFVVTVYDLMVLDHPSLCRPGNVAHYRLLLPRTIRNARGIIVPSEATARDVRSRFPASADRIRVIPLGIHERFRTIPPDERDAAVRDRYGLPERFILFVGNIAPNKNLPRLIEACHLLRSLGGAPHKLVVAGESGWGHGEAADRARNLGLREDVVFAGYVAEADLPHVYNMADLFAFPSLHEGFGIPPLEAMRCGVPVVASDRGAIPELTDGAAVLVNPLDCARMAEAMQSVLTDERRRRECIARGLEVSARFSWERTARETEAFYRNVWDRCRPDRTPSTGKAGSRAT